MSHISTTLITALEGGLIASCQPVKGGPLDHPEIVAALVRAAELGGAAGVRVEGIENVRAAREVTELPIVGLIKVDAADDEAFITPELAHVDALAKEGADVIAFDATLRRRPTPIQELIDRIHGLERLAMADCSSLEDGSAALTAGADFLATTLSGYTAATRPRDAPDFELVEQLASLGVPVVAEGHIRTPEQAAKARASGAHVVTVGSAITRPELITEWFVDAVAGVGRRHLAEKSR